MQERPGRPPVTSRSELEQVALELFAVRGFDATTVEDITAVAGVGRRTFFRYFPSKNDAVWGEFDRGLVELEARLDATGDEVPLLAALRAAVLAFNALPADQLGSHRQRMALILTVPALQAHSTLRYAAWRDVVARFAARRLGLAGDELLPQLVAHTCLGAALTAYEQWLRRPDSDLGALLHEAMSGLDGAWAR